MYSAVRQWLESPPVDAKVVARAGELWVDGGDSHRIARMLKLNRKEELYELRPFLGWPRRHSYPIENPRIPVTWTQEELELAKRQWDGMEPGKIIADTLHLKDRRQVYLIVRQFGWKSRQKGGRTATDRRAEIREQLREILKLSPRERKRLAGGPIGRPRKYPRKPEPEGEPEPEAQHKRVVLKFDDLPTGHLARVCPTCDGRVTPHPEYSVRVRTAEGEELLFHARCLPPEIGAAA